MKNESDNELILLTKTITKLLNNDLINLPQNMVAAYVDNASIVEICKMINEYDFSLDIMGEDWEASIEEAALILESEEWRIKYKQLKDENNRLKHEQKQWAKRIAEDVEIITDLTKEWQLNLPDGGKNEEE
jgi:type II secretory pathway component PulJ